MPKRCCVPGCKSNYDSSLKVESRKSSFKFSKNELLRKKWIRAIPKKDWISSESQTECCLHFNSYDIVKKDDIITLPDGMTQIFPGRPKLKENAVSAIFPNLPKYLSSEKPYPRKDPKCRRQNQIEHNEQLIEQFLASDCVENYCFLIQSFESKINMSDCWNTKVLDSKIVFYTLNSDADYIIIENQIEINQNLGVVLHKKNELNYIMISSGY
nr:unnamed protein product [Callosobruchus analis]